MLQLRLLVQQRACLERELLCLTARATATIAATVTIATAAHTTATNATVAAATGV